MAVDHIGLAVHGIGPDLNHALGVGVPAVHAAQRVALLLALGVHALLELEPGWVNRNLGSRSDLLAGEQTVGDDRHPFAVEQVQAINHVGLGELFPVPAGQVLDAAEQFRAVLRRSEAFELGGGQRLPLSLKWHHRISQRAAGCCRQIDAGRGAHLHRWPLLDQIVGGLDRVIGLDRNRQLLVVELLEHRQSNVSLRQGGVVIDIPNVLRLVGRVGGQRSVGVHDGPARRHLLAGDGLRRRGRLLGSLPRGQACVLQKVGFGLAEADISGRRLHCFGREGSGPGFRVGLDDPPVLQLFTAGRLLLDGAGAAAGATDGPEATGQATSQAEAEHRVGDEGCTCCLDSVHPRLHRIGNVRGKAGAEHVVDEAGSTVDEAHRAAAGVVVQGRGDRLVSRGAQQQAGGPAHKRRGLGWIEELLECRSLGPNERHALEALQGSTTSCSAEEAQGHR